MAQHPETRLQIAVATYLSRCLGDGTAWCHIPNGGTRSLTEGRIFKASGVKAGEPDIEIIWQGRIYKIELKTGKVALSEAQRYRHSALIAAGCPVAVCRSLDAVRAQVFAWGIPTRETTRSTERMTRGFNVPLDARIAPTLSGVWDWSESTDLGRRRRKKDGNGG